MYGFASDLTWIDSAVILLTTHFLYQRWDFIIAVDIVIAIHYMTLSSILIEISFRPSASGIFVFVWVFPLVIVVDSGASSLDCLERCFR